MKTVYLVWAEIVDLDGREDAVWSYEHKRMIATRLVAICDDRAMADAVADDERRLWVTEHSLDNTRVSIDCMADKDSEYAPNTNLEHAYDAEAYVCGHCTGGTIWKA